VCWTADLETAALSREGIWSILIGARLSGFAGACLVIESRNDATFALPTSRLTTLMRVFSLASVLAAWLRNGNLRLLRVPPPALICTNSKHPVS